MTDRKLKRPELSLEFASDSEIEFLNRMCILEQAKALVITFKHAVKQQKPLDNTSKQEYSNNITK